MSFIERLPDACCSITSGNDMHNIPHTKEAKLKMSLAKKGKHISPKTEFKKGDKRHKNWYKAMNKKGKEHWNWKGGLSYEQYSINWTDDLKESIRKRDNYICQICGIHQEELDMGQLTKLDIHHIDYDKYNLNPKNLITLCRSCHVKTNYNREYWIENL